MAHGGSRLAKRSQTKTHAYAQKLQRRRERFTISHIPSLDELIGLAGKTGVEAAKDGGVHLSTLRKWLAGKVRNPAAREVAGLAAALGVDYETARAAIVHQHQINQIRLMQFASGSRPHEWILRRAGERELSGADLADACAISRQTLYRWVRGRTRPNYERQINLALALSLDAEEVFARFAAV